MRLFLLASQVSFIGDGMRYAALPLLAAESGAGPKGLGILLGSATLPFLVLGIFGGVLADRLRRRSLLIACDIIRFGVTALFVILIVAGHAQLPVLYGVAFLMGLLESVATSATFAYLPSLAAEKDLERANGMSSTALLLGRQFVGPLIGAALVASSSALPFLLDCASFLASFVVLTAIPKQLEKSPAAPAVGAGPRSVFSDIGASARWMRVAPHVLTIAGTAAVINLFNMGALALQPQYVKEILHNSGFAYGLLMAASALGGVIGAQAAAPLTARVRRGQLVCLALLFIGGGYLLVAVADIQFTAYAGMCVTGLGFSLWGVATTSWRQRLTPDHLRGRADALHRAISWGVNPIGSVLGGFLASTYGTRLPFLLVGIAPLLLLPVFFWRGDTAEPDGSELPDADTDIRAASG